MTSEEATLDGLLEELKGSGDAEQMAVLARYGVYPPSTFGVPMPKLREIGSRLGTDHDLAQALWGHGTRETEILASMVEDPECITAEEADAWVAAIDYWEIADQCALNLFWRRPFAYDKVGEWIDADGQYVKRAGVALAAALAMKDEAADDERILALLPLVEEASVATRPHLRQACEWALKEIGRRNVTCYEATLVTARRMLEADGQGNKPWIGGRVVAWLESDEVRGPLGL